MFGNPISDFVGIVNFNEVRFVSVETMVLGLHFSFVKLVTCRISKLKHVSFTTEWGMAVCDWLGCGCFKQERFVMRARSSS